MYDNYNYPPGADTPDAPWNEKEVPEIEVSLDLTVLLRKTSTVCTDNYNMDGDYIELHDGHIGLEQLYNGQHNSIPMLLQELAKYINVELAGGDISRQRKEKLEAMLEDCVGWETVDMEVEDHKIE